MRYKRTANKNLAQNVLSIMYDLRIHDSRKLRWKKWRGFSRATRWKRSDDLDDRRREIPFHSLPFSPLWQESREQRNYEGRFDDYIIVTIISLIKRRGYGFYFRLYFALSYCRSKQKHTNSLYMCVCTSSKYKINANRDSWYYLPTVS